VTTLAASRHGAALGDDAAIGAQQHGHHGCSFEVVVSHQQAGKASLSREAYTGSKPDSGRLMKS